MKERIAKIIKVNNISATAFAEKVGIQRSAVSHLLSGRNNASLDVIQKIIKAFPDINTDWLIFGTGNMLKSNAQYNDVTETSTSTNKSSIKVDNIASKQSSETSRPERKQSEVVNNQVQKPIEQATPNNSQNNNLSQPLFIAGGGLIILDPATKTYTIYQQACN